MYTPSTKQTARAAQTPGVPEDMLDLLATFAVNQAKDAHARQLAMASGQMPPTVKQEAEQTALNSARQEISQKLGLSGMMQQQPQAAPMPGMSAPGGTPAAPPMGPPQANQNMPMQGPPMQGPPMQQMAAGGLTRLRSGLPQSYAGGGIIAFNGTEDPLVPDLSQFDPKDTDTLADRQYKKAMLLKAIEARQAAKEARTEGDRASLMGDIKDLFGIDPAPSNEGREGRGYPAPPVQQAIPPQPDPGVIPGQRPPAPAPVPPGQRPPPPAPPGQRPPPPAPPGPPATQGGLDRLAASQRTRGPVPGAPAAVAPDLSGAVIGAIIGGIGANKEKLEEEAEIKAKTRYDAEIGAAQKQFGAERQEAIARAEAAYAADMAARERLVRPPSIWEKLGSWNPQGWDPKSTERMMKMDQDYATQQTGLLDHRAKGLAGIEAMRAAQSTGKLGDVKERYQYGDATRTATASAAADARKQGIVSGTSMVNQQANDKTQMEIARMNAAAQRYASDSRVQAALMREQDADKKEQIRASAAALQQIPAMLKNAQSDYTTPPAEVAKTVAQLKRDFIFHQQNLARLTGMPVAEGVDPPDIKRDMDKYGKK